MWTDDAGNLIGYIPAVDGLGDDTRVRTTPTGRNRLPAPAARHGCMAHMDELSMLIKRVEPDGTLHMTQLGVMYPGNFGLGPVALLGDHETLTAVLTLGSEHTTKESPRIWETKPDQGDRALDWQHVYVFTGRTPEDLAAAGVHAGTRVCVDRSKRDLVEFGNYVGAYFLDDRAAVTALLRAARLLRDGGQRPAEDVVSRVHHQRGDRRSGRLLHQRDLPGKLTLALEVGPTEREYATSCHRRPDHRLQRCVMRLRQRRRRPADEDRHRAWTVASAGDVGRVHVRRLAREGQRADAARRAALPAHAEHPRFRSHATQCN